MEWLKEFGRKHPGHVLYPTSDEIAWLISSYLDELKEHYLLYSPPVATLDRILDKSQLHDACREARIATPDTWYPRDGDDLDTIASKATFPVLLKQRTQVLSLSHSKGVIVNSRDTFHAAYRQFVQENHYSELLSNSCPEMCYPMVQTYHSDSATRSFVVAGFIDRTGGLFVARCANKILQWPRRLGIALCLEDMPLTQELADRVRLLCKTVGYFGVFQIEFLRARGRELLIDFNPRYYHHMAFGIARGVPAPMLAHIAAMGEVDALRMAIDAAARMPQSHGKTAFTYGLDLQILLTTQQLSGRMPKAEATKWRQWRSQSRERLVDAVADPLDRIPGFADAVSHLFNHLRHPRAFMRKIAFGD